jgi:CTP:molybdopterin cytidylyltransferase MocA
MINQGCRATICQANRKKEASTRNFDTSILWHGDRPFIWDHHKSRLRAHATGAGTEATAPLPNLCHAGKMVHSKGNAPLLLRSMS